MQPDTVAVEAPVPSGDMDLFNVIGNFVAENGWWSALGVVVLIGLLVAIYRGTFMKLVRQVFHYLRREQAIDAAEAGVDLPKDKEGD